MKSLHEYGVLYGTDKATYHNYCGFYEKELAGLKPKVILEIGVLGGASLRMWKAFYPEARVIGIDIEKPIEVFDCEVYQCDATNPVNIFNLLNSLEIKEIDLIIDDGSHMTGDQQGAFIVLANGWLSKKGIYIIEDVQTSYFTAFRNSTLNIFEFLENCPNYEAKQFWNREDKSDSGTILIRNK